MKRMVWSAVFGVAVVLVAMWLAARFSPHRLAAAPQEAQPMEAEGLKEYVGSPPLLAVAFRYPADWIAQEEGGRRQPFQQVRMLGPRNAEETYRCYVAVSAVPSAAAGGRHATAEAMADNYTRHLPGEGTVLASRETSLAGARGRDVTVSYTQSEWRFHGVHKSGRVPIKARTLIVEKESVLYQLTFSADAREYEQHATAFEQLLRSFRFL